MYIPTGVARTTSRADSCALLLLGTAIALYRTLLHPHPISPHPTTRRYKSQHRLGPLALALALALGTGKPAITEFMGPWALTGHHSRRNPAAGAGAGAAHVGVRACGWAGTPRCSSVPMMVVAAVVVVVVVVVVVLYTAAAEADIYEDGTAGRTARKQCSGMFTDPAPSGCQRS